MQVSRLMELESRFTTSGMIDLKKVPPGVIISIVAIGIVAASLIFYGYVLWQTLD